MSAFEGEIVDLEQVFVKDSQVDVGVAEAVGEGPVGIQSLLNFLQILEGLLSDGHLGLEI